MKYVFLSNLDAFALIDDADFDLVNQYNWRATSCNRMPIYAVTGAHQAPYGNFVTMHNLIKPPPNGLFVDHIDRNGLNNQRNNLRFATNSQNKANSSAYDCNTSGYKGVTFRKERGTWRAQIRHEGRLIIIGTFHDVIDAAKAYDKKAIELFGEYAYLNFPNSLVQ